MGGGKRASDWVSHVHVGKDLVAFGMEDEHKGGGGVGRERQEPKGVVQQRRGRGGTAHEESTWTRGRGIRESTSQEEGRAGECGLR